MKNLNIMIITGLILLIIASMSCSKHCYDEDYTRDSNLKKL
jgi:hypothetical protein